MKKIFLCLLMLVCMTSGEAAYTIRKGYLVHVDNVPSMPPEGHYQAGIEAYTQSKWDEAAKHFNILALNFPELQITKDGYFYLGASYFADKEYEDANLAFSNYLKAQNHPSYLEEALDYKLKIANSFTEGARRRILGWRGMPKILPAHDSAQQIYDEIIATFPCHNLAAQALYAKGHLHWKDKEFRDSISAFQQLIKHFPKHELAPECYAFINKIYLEQCLYEYQNPDLLAFADLNHKKFSQEFPGEEKINDAEQDVQRIREVYAFGLYDTGQFYERTKKPKAAMIYYKNALKQFPETEMAKKCRDRLTALGVGKEEIAAISQPPQM